MSFINSLTYNLSRFLSRILSSLLVNCYSVCNSKEFVDRVQNFTISENEILVSFDVVSLFTSIPVDKALGFVLDLLYSDESLASRTSLDIPDITKGLEHYFSSSVFSYKNSFFKQIYCTLLGSCISPIIASIYMEHIKNTAVTTFHTPPSLWLRYVNDTFCILNKDHVNDLQTHVNSICSHIQLIIKKNTIILSCFLTFWLNAVVAMVASPRTTFHLTQFTENPRTLTDIFTTRHIRSSPLTKLYLAGLKLTSQKTHRSTVSYKTYAVPCD